MLIAPEGTRITLYRPDSLGSFLQEWMAGEKSRFPGLIIEQKPLPPSLRELNPLSAIVWDSLLGNLPYPSPVHVIRHQLGQPFPYSPSQLVALALWDQQDIDLQVLSVWTFEREGRQVLALAVQA